MRNDKKSAMKRANLLFEQRIKEAPEQDWTHYQEKQGQEDSMGGPSEDEIMFGKFRQKIESLRNVANEANNMNASVEDVGYELQELNAMFANYKQKLQDDNDMYDASMEAGETHGY